MTPGIGSGNGKDTEKQKTILTRKGILTAGVGNPTQMKQRQLQGNWFRHKVNGTVKRKKRKEEKKRMDGQGK